jgi:hypothetical protein
MNEDKGPRLEALNISLTNHTPCEAAINDIEWFRARAKEFGEAIIMGGTDRRERSLALTHLEDAVMWAVKGIVLDDLERDHAQEVTKLEAVAQLEPEPFQGEAMAVPVSLGPDPYVALEIEKQRRMTRLQALQATSGKAEDDDARLTAAKKIMEFLDG